MTSILEYFLNHSTNWKGRSMNDVQQTFSELFWKKEVWLPANYTWKDVAPGLRNGIQYREYKDLYYAIPMAFALFGLRHCLEKLWFAPWGKLLGIKQQRINRAEDNPTLEKAYLEGGATDHKQIQGLAKKLGWNERHVQRWLRLRKSHDRPSPLVKFCETAWRLLYYFSSFTLSIAILWDKPWLWDVQHCWVNYPHHEMPSGVWWQYIISLGLYISLCISQFLDVKRKDFWQLFIHHIVTIDLMWLSWVLNCHRVGSLIILIHDSADIFLEGAKLCKYAAYDKAAEVLLFLFTTVWFITRLGIFPSKIVYNLITEVPKFYQPYPAFYIFIGMLSMLFVLHLIWTYFILKIIYKGLMTGVHSDSRSSSSECSDDS